MLGNIVASVLIILAVIWLLGGFSSGGDSGPRGVQ
jgi:hypothetical protein